MATWQRIFGSRADFASDTTVEDRTIQRENAKAVERNKRAVEQPLPAREDVPQEQLDAARKAAQAILDSDVITGEVVIRLNGNDGPDNCTDSVSVTVSQR